MYQIFRILGRLSGNGLLKVCVDISYQVKAIEVTETCSEEAAITDTWPTREIIHMIYISYLYYIVLT